MAEMAAYLTTAGLKVLNKVIAAQGALTFTRAELGSGVCYEEAACRARTSLVTKVANATLVSARYEGGEAKITAQYKNTGLANGFFVNEIGFYVLDPTTSNQVLYCYATFGDGSTPDWIAPESSATYTRTYDVSTIVAGAASVTVQADPSSLVTTADFEAQMKIFDAVLLANISETSAMARAVQDEIDQLSDDVEDEFEAVRNEAEDRDDLYADSQNILFFAALNEYDALIRNLSDRLATVEGQIASLTE